VIIVKSLGSAWGLEYSWFVRGTSINSCVLCSLSLFLSLSLYLSLYLCLYSLHNFLKVAILEKYLRKTKHNSTSQSCVYPSSIKLWTRVILLWFYSILPLFSCFQYGILFNTTNHATIQPVPLFFLIVFHFPIIMYHSSMV
jgi:hypothetical protein